MSWPMMRRRGRKVSEYFSTTPGRHTARFGILREAERIVAMFLMRMLSVRSRSVPPLESTVDCQRLCVICSKAAVVATDASRPCASPAVLLSVSAVAFVAKSPVVVAGAPDRTAVLALVFTDVTVNGPPARSVAPVVS